MAFAGLFDTTVVFCVSWEVCLSVGIATGTECHETTLRSAKKTPMMKLSKNKVPNSFAIVILVATRS